MLEKELTDTKSEMEILESERREMEAEVNVVQALKAHVVQLEQAVQAADEKTAVLKSTNEDLQMKMTVDLKDAQAATVGAEAAGQVILMSLEPAHFHRQQFVMLCFD